MLHACVQRFDVMGNLKKFCKILGTKQALGSEDDTRRSGAIPLSLVGVWFRDKGNKIILREKYSSRFEDTFVSQKCVTHLSHGYVVLFRLFASPLPYVGRG